MHNPMTMNKGYRNLTRCSNKWQCSQVYWETLDLALAISMKTENFTTFSCSLTINLTAWKQPIRLNSAILIKSCSGSIFFINISGQISQRKRLRCACSWHCQMLRQTSGDGSVLCSALTIIFLHCTQKALFAGKALL